MVCKCYALFNSRPALLTKLRLGRAFGLAGTAGVELFRGAVTYHQVADVGNPSERVSKDEDGIALVKQRVSQQAA